MIRHGGRSWALWPAVAMAASAALATIALLLAWESLNASRLLRLAVCPSLDVLSWDGNLRLIGVLDQRSMLMRGDLPGGLLLLFSAETWPPLRDVLQHLAFAVHPAGVSVASSVSISLVFFALLFPSGLYILTRLLGMIRGALGFAVFAAAISYGHEFHRYALTGMLETQGMFLLLWGAFFLIRLYAVPNASADTWPARSARWGVAVSFCGLFFTKYPYGAMALVGLAAAELVLRPRLYLDIGLELWGSHYRGWRAGALCVFVFALVPLSASGAMGDGGSFARAWKAAVYLFCLFFIGDFYWMLFRRRDYLWEQLPPTMRALQMGVFLPTLAWLLLHPTRFKTVLGTQQRIVEGVGSDRFLEMLFTQSIGIRGLIATLVTGAALVAWFQWRRIHGSRRGAKSLAGSGRGSTGSISASPPVPAVAVVSLLVFIGVNLLLLDVSTVNRQERHIFHLLPALLLILTFLCFRGPGWRAQVAVGAVVVGISAVSLQPDRAAFRPAPTPAVLCANPPNAFVEPAREMARDVDPDYRYVLINRYHELTARWPHRALATPVDLLLRLRVLHGRGLVRNDNRYRYGTWAEFDRLLVVSASCEDQLTELAVALRAEKTGAHLGSPVERRYGGGHYCVREYVLGAKLIPSPSRSGGTQ